MPLRKFATLAGVVVCGACGDVFLARGMKQLGPVSLSDPAQLIAALFHPWVALGVLFLIGFFISYLVALSFADLTYVLPATSVGYVLTALLARFFLHEHMSASRWLGIAIIVVGVGFVTRTPAKTAGSPDAGQSRGDA